MFKQLSIPCKLFILTYDVHSIKVVKWDDQYQSAIIYRDALKKCYDPLKFKKLISCNEVEPQLAPRLGLQAHPKNKFDTLA